MKFILSLIALSGVAYANAGDYQDASQNAATSNHWWLDNDVIDNALNAKAVV